MENKRDDFSTKTKELLKQRAAYICSNPSCKKMTIAPSVEGDNMIQLIGVCAHITAAIKDGPRFEKTINQTERSSLNNGIYLCSNCATLIDKNNGIDYSVSTLKKWKEEHELWVLNQLNKSVAEKDVIIENITQAGNNITNNITLNNNNENLFIEKRRQNILNHDKNIFLSASEIINETTLREVIDTLICEESILIDEKFTFETLITYYTQASNQYISDELETLKNNFIKSLTELDDFISTEFDMWPYNQKSSNFKICMKPTVNSDRAGKLEDMKEHREHERLVKILEKTTKNVLLDYEKLRREIKIQMHF